MSKELILRSITCLIGIPLILGIIYKGSPYFDILIFLTLGGMLGEWSRLNTSFFCHPVSFVIFAQILLFFFGPPLSLSTHALITTVWIGAGFALSHLSFKRYLLFIVGIFYISSSMIVLLSWHQQTFLILWLLTLVWSTDIGAYFAGSKLGGPKLAASISPGKTWSGFIGGILIAILICYQMGLNHGYDLKLPIALPISIVILSIAAQLGDLLESAAKRYFNVKDSGHIIPGHGGLLDRLDSLLLVILCYKFLLIFSKF